MSSFLHKLDRKAQVQVGLAWGVSLLVCILFSFFAAELSWFEVPLSLGPLDVSLTFYPTLVVCLPWVLWFGFGWGFIPAVVSAFILAYFTSGMPLLWSCLFAFSHPLGLALFAFAYYVVPIPSHLRSSPSFFFFLLVSFVASLLGSSSSFIWGYTNTVVAREALTTWQGWLTGCFLQLVLIAGPFFYFFTPTVRRWLRTLPYRNGSASSIRRKVTFFAALMLFGVLCYTFVVQYFSIQKLNETFVLIPDTELHRMIWRAFEGFSATEWITVVLVGFIVFFSYQVFDYWVNRLKRSMMALRSVNRRLQHEIQERKRMEAQLMSSGQAKDHFFSIIAHDMRGSIASFMGLSELFVIEAEAIQNQEVFEMAQLLNRSAENVYAFLENLLQWSRIQSGTMLCDPIQLNLHTEAHFIGTILQGQASQKDVSLHLSVPENLTAYVDDNMFRSILHNVLTNALKYTPPGGSVSLTASRQGDTVHLEVKDTGVGMSPEELAGLFHVGSKVSTPGTEGEQGFGLGLILCKDFVEKNRGTLTIESTPDVGTTIRITVPAVSSSPPLPKEPIPSRRFFGAADPLS